jgi:hypothetical protein
MLELNNPHFGYWIVCLGEYGTEQSAKRFQPVNRKFISRFNVAGEVDWWKTDNQKSLHNAHWTIEDIKYWHIRVLYIFTFLHWINPVVPLRGCRRLLCLQDSVCVSWEGGKSWGFNLPSLLSLLLSDHQCCQILFASFGTLAKKQK